MPSLASPRPMRLICLSPSRSGTHALYEALGLLGYQPYHFIETLKQGISHQKLARELLDAWQSGTALTEVPAYAVPQMVAAYPEAKFLLLERSPKSWAKSFQEAVIPEARRAGQFPANFLKLMDAGFREFNDMFYIIGHEVSGGAFNGPGGFENCIRWYKEQYVSRLFHPSVFPVFPNRRPERSDPTKLSPVS
ncbi:P-loop containing nucleoside triphosphate hydrolase protein [Apiospora phragmitis]|uniref:P-loop containing nucleoside triphosphate hydrolase protein n=1 Tax=Apiospora phragmitis TaxID=2905665 RepID=A0ABR1SRE9_9PEZI